MSTTVSTAEILEAFGAAARRLDLNVPVRQTDCKPLTILILDELIGRSNGFENRPMLWASGQSPGVRLKYCRFAPGESMLDVSVFRGTDDPFEAIWTAESEAYAEHYTGAGANSSNSGYAWDLYKLLQIPSPKRLFLCRTTRGRYAAVWGLIEKLVTAYAPLYRPGDQIFAIVLPTALRDSHRIECRGWLKRRRSDAETLPPATTDLPVNSEFQPRQD